MRTLGAEFQFNRSIVHVAAHGSLQVEQTLLPTTEKKLRKPGSDVKNRVGLGSA